MLGGLGGLGGMNPGKMKAMMKQLGINQEEIEADRVIIEKSEGRIVIDKPNVQKVTMQGQVSWQITGESREEEIGIKESDVLLVMEKTGKSKEKAIKALQETNGDIAEAIIKLSE